MEDEARCPTSGYSIDMLVHVHDSSLGGESSSRGGAWAVEFDGPSHFLASGAPTGATLLKRRYLQLLGHTLVSVPTGPTGSGKDVRGQATGSSI